MARAVAPRVEAVPVPARVAANALGAAAADPQMLGLDTEASFALQKVMIDIDYDFYCQYKGGLSRFHDIVLTQCLWNENQRTSAMLKESDWD